jgi:hypothetical protein
MEVGDVRKTFLINSIVGIPLISSSSILFIFISPKGSD